MEQGRSGMGSHKHGTSGKAPRSPAYKQQQTRNANRLAEEEKQKQVKPVMYPSLKDAMDKESY